MISAVTRSVDGSQGSSFHFKRLSINNGSEIVPLFDVTACKFVNLASFLEDKFG